MIASPPLVSVHPRLPGVELWRGPRSGAHHLIVHARAFSAAELVDLGQWLMEQGREQADTCGC